MCLLAVPWYMRPIPITAATCTLCGTSSSVDVGGNNADICILKRRTVATSILPRLRYVKKIIFIIDVHSIKK